MTMQRKIIIDTNLWISFLLSKKFDFLDYLLEVEKVQLIFSKELFEELVEVASRSKLKKFFKKEDWKFIFTIIERYAVFIPVTSVVTECRDKKDDFLLSLAKDSNADYLLTGDKDLLVLRKFNNTQIITISDFQIMF
jgi:putative toxin-antitoxin system toxin component, PIN family